MIRIEFGAILYYKYNKEPPPHSIDQGSHITDKKASKGILPGSRN